LYSGERTGAYGKKLDIRMNTQNELFHEDWRDALKHLVKALGGYDAVGVDLWPSKTRKAAGSWLSDCLNIERPAKLELEEIQSLLAMGRAIGCHIAIEFLCESTDYSRPTTIEPEDTLAEVERQMDHHLATFGKLLKQFERARAAAVLKAVK